MNRYQKKLTDEKALLIVERLLNHFGEQKWWPADTPFEVCVGAILTQSVAWVNVMKAIDLLKKDELLDPRSLVITPDETLYNYVYSTRFYKQKAKRLKTFCLFLTKHYNGDLKSLFSGKTERIRTQLLSLWGIGEETADSMLLYAGEHRVVVVDAYTRRVFSRMGFWPKDATYRQMQDVLKAVLPLDTAMLKEFHALVVEQGKNICKANKPNCKKCCLSDMCSRVI